MKGAEEMPEFREKPKAGKAKSRPPGVLPPEQAVRLMKEKYRQQLDQRPDGSDGEATYATEQVEEAGGWAVDEVFSHAPRPRQRRKNPLKEKPQPDREAPTAEGRAQKPPTGSRSEETAQPKRRAGKRPASGLNAPKERSGPAIKERSRQPTTTRLPGQRPTASRTPWASRRKSKPALPTSPGSAPYPDAPASPDESARLTPNQRQVLLPGQCSSSPASPPPVRGSVPQPARSTPVKSSVPAQSQYGTKGPRLRERTRTAFKTRSTVPAKKSGAPPVKGKPQLAKAQGMKAARQTAQRQMSQRMVAQAQKAAKATMTAARKAAEATVRASVALVSGLVGLLGGGVLLVILLLVAVIAAVASSPFGLFFASEPNAPDTVSVAEAVAQVNMAYNTVLEELQAGDYDSIVIHGQAPDWPDVLAVFAARYAGAEDGVDVATLDADRVAKLASTFWDMTAITSEVETIDHPGDGEDDPGWTEYILHITITPKTAEEMKAVYGFTAYQISALDELLADRAALASLAGSLTITSADVRSVLDALPGDLPPERRKAVETALQLVGKVNYFWGGKSYVIGWDSRWGQLVKVTSPGNSTTGTYRPYGLDCTGFIDWALRNAGLPSDGHWYIGTNLTEVIAADAQPGDLALYPDASHIGMVVGRDESGNLLICHCSSGRNNVVVTEFAASGFTALGRPGIYGT